MRHGTCVGVSRTPHANPRGAGRKEKPIMRRQLLTGILALSFVCVPALVGGCNQTEEEKKTVHTDPDTGKKTVDEKKVERTPDGGTKTTEEHKKTNTN
jgi:hypothetical protein